MVLGALGPETCENTIVWQRGTRRPGAPEFNRLNNKGTGLINTLINGLINQELGLINVLFNLLFNY